MSTTLCFDFGNTRKKAAIFSGSEIIKTITLDDDSLETIQFIDQYI